MEQIDSILGKQISHNIILVGYGKIGKALVNYRGFESESIRIVAAFDHNPEKIDRIAKASGFASFELMYIIKSHQKVLEDQDDS